MNEPIASGRSVAAPRLTKVLAETLCFGVLAQAAFAGGFLGGHHMWHSWHQALGDFIILVPLANLIVGLVARRRQPDASPMLVTRVLLLVLVISTGAAGHAGGSALALHIPLAVATISLAVWHATVASQGTIRPW